MSIFVENIYDRKTTKYGASAIGRSNSAIPERVMYVPCMSISKMMRKLI